MSTIKFEKGKFYKTRDGRKAECVHTNAGVEYQLLFVIDGDCNHTTTTDGSYVVGEEKDLDIVSEWKQERVVWVVWSGWSRSAFVYDLYSEAFRFYTALSEHPANSITRVVIQDGHVDTE